MTRLHLAPPMIGESEIDAVESALRSGWIAPIGLGIDAFEAELAL